MSHISAQAGKSLPTVVSGDQDPEILQIIVQFVKAKFADGTIDALRKNQGDWEGWLQVEVARELQIKLASSATLKDRHYLIEREQRVTVSHDPTRELRARKSKQMTFSDSRTSTSTKVKSSASGNSSKSRGTRQDLASSSTPHVMPINRHPVNGSLMAEADVPESAPEEDEPSIDDVGGNDGGDDDDSDYEYGPDDLEDDPESDFRDDSAQPNLPGLCDLWITPSPPKGSKLISTPDAYAIQLKADQHRRNPQPLSFRFGLDVQKLWGGIAPQATQHVNDTLKAAGAAPCKVRCIAIGVTASKDELSLAWKSVITNYRSKVNAILLGNDKKGPAIIWSEIGDLSDDKNNQNAGKTNVKKSTTQTSDLHASPRYVVKSML